MTLRFLGTRGEIEKQTRRHRRHSALMVEAGRDRVMVDCGLDWLDAFKRLEPTAIVITHAHRDHIGGLKQGAPCPVYATPEAWEALDRYGIPEREVVHPRVPVDLGGVGVEAFSVDHSVRAPAVGYRLEVSGGAVFYVPDVVSIHGQLEALAGLDLYVGDGASLTRPIVRRKDGTPIGHVSIRTQLDWCAAAGVPRAIFTHCGSQIVTGDAREVARRVKELGRERCMQAEIAHDGLEIMLAGAR